MKTNVAITSGYLISGERNTVHPCSKRTRTMRRDNFNISLTFVPPPSLDFYFPDLLLMFYYWKAIGDKFFVVHHLAALYAYYYVLVSALLSNSRACRQDGKETTKGEQLCPVELGVSTGLAAVQAEIDQAL